MKDKIKTIIIIGFITFFALGVIGFSYAYYKLQVEGAITTNTISLGKLDLNFLNTNTLNLTNALPIYESNRYTEASYIGFTVDGSATDFEGCYELVLDITQIDDELKDETFKWEFYDETNGSTIFSGNFEHNSDINDISLMAFQSLTLETNHTYKVLIYIAWDNVKDQTAMMGKTFKARIKATSIMGGCFDGQDATILAYTFSGEGTAPTSFPRKYQGYKGTSVECTGAEGATWDNNRWGVTFENVATLTTPIMCRVNFIYFPTLADAIIRDNPEYLTQRVEDDTMFEKVAVSQEYYDSLPDTATGYNVSKDRAIVQNGLWTENRAGKTEGDLPVHFFRGAVQNNYVSFADKMWRIVRINGDGSVKLILEGDSATNMYGGGSRYFNAYSIHNYEDTNSELRESSERWYTTNLSIYDDFLSYTIFCRDETEGELIPSGYIAYGSYIRVSGNGMNFTTSHGDGVINPQLICPEAGDNLIYKVGSMTADELILAGGAYYIPNQSYYLNDNINATWWLISPAGHSSSMGSAFIVSSGYLNTSVPTSIYDLRPVITLKSNVQILRGDGTQGDPYVITE